MSRLALFGIVSIVFGVLVILVLLNFRIADLRKEMGLAPKDVNLDVAATVFALFLVVVGFILIGVSANKP
jgi:hypothetical protein